MGRFRIGLENIEFHSDVGNLMHERM